MGAISDWRPDFGAMLEAGAAQASVAAQAVKDDAKTLYMQNLPLHGSFWEYVPPEQSADGTRTAGRVRLTDTGLKWALVAGAVFLGASVMSRGR